MTQNHDNTVSRKGKHLTYSERCQIAILKKENYSNRQVADVLGCVPQTINNEIKRGTVTQLNRQNQNGKVYDYYHDVYDADAGQAAYEKNRLNCGRRPLWADTDAFIEWADDMMLLEKWSPDVVVGFARKHEFVRPGHYPWDHHPLSVDRPWHHENEEYGPARKTVPQTEIVPSWQPPE